MPNYESMTLAELDKKYLELRKKKVETKAEMIKLNEAREKRIDEKKVREKLEGMTAKEQKIAAQMITNVGQIESKEAVGKPGTK